MSNNKNYFGFSSLTALMVVLCARPLAGADPLARTRDALSSCKSAGWKSQLLTQKDAILPHRGGVVVASLAQIDYVSYGTPVDDDSSPRSLPVDKWVFSTNSRPVRIAMNLLAPGLFVITPTGGQVTQMSIDNQTDPAVSVTWANANETASAAVAPSRVLRSHKLISQGVGASRVLTEIDTEFEEAIPPGTSAIITYRFVAGAPVASLFSVVYELSKSQVTYADTGRCGMLPAGAAVPSVGERVAFSFVSYWGTVSKLSNSVVLVE